MLLHKSVERDSRVRREAHTLTAAGHDVTVVHLPPTRHAAARELDGFHVVCATPRSWVRALPFQAYRLAFLASFVRRAVHARPDVVHVHDAPMLAPGMLVAHVTGARLVYDSHELATGVPYRERFWAGLVRALERVALPRCAAVITVSDGIAERLQELYGLQRRPAVVRNVPDADTAAEGVAGLRERLGIGSAPLVLHQGALAPRRGCEALVSAVARLPDAHLVFLGDAWPGYDGVVERHAREVGAADRVHFVPSVPIGDLLRCTREADVGVSLLTDDCENHRLALPNKVFEYIAAGVPVVVSDLPELRRLVEEHGIGWIADPHDPAALARALGGAVAGKTEMRAALSRAARELRWSAELPRLLAVYDGLAGDEDHERASDDHRALVFVRNGVTHDARVLREGRLLQRLGYTTTVIGVVTAQQQERKCSAGGVAVIRLKPGAIATPRREGTGSPAGVTPQARGPSRRRTLRRLLVTLDWYRRGIGIVLRTRPKLVHCNDYNTMWIGVAAKLSGSMVVYDAHELWPDRNLRPESRAWLLVCEWLFVRVADRLITTSPAYAAVMAKRYAVAPPSVVRNIPDGVIRGDVREPHDPPRLVYFGALTRNRGLEDALALLLRLPDVRLRLVGPDSWGYRNVLVEEARRLGLVDRVEVLDPVPPESADTVLAEADIGLALIKPVCLSYKLTLPNKLFEYTLAGLPILATRLPAISAFVDRWQVGETVEPDDLDGLEAAVRRMLSPRNSLAFQRAARRAATQLSWESEQRVLASIYANGRTRAA
jgi:glycosyltransferase involved in cell wall biosynthesis